MLICSAVLNPHNKKVFITQIRPLQELCSLDSGGIHYNVFRDSAGFLSLLQVLAAKFEEQHKQEILSILEKTFQIKQGTRTPMPTDVKAKCMACYPSSCCVHCQF